MLNINIKNYFLILLQNEINQYLIKKSNNTFQRNNTF